MLGVPAGFSHVHVAVHCLFVFWYWGRPPALLGVLALLGMLKCAARTVFILVDSW